MGPDLRAERIAPPLTSFEGSVQRVQVVGKSFKSQPDAWQNRRSLIKCGIRAECIPQAPQSIFREAGTEPVAGQAQGDLERVWPVVGLGIFAQHASYLSELRPIFASAREPPYCFSGGLKMCSPAMARNSRSVPMI